MAKKSSFVLFIQLSKKWLSRRSHRSIKLSCDCDSFLLLFDSRKNRIVLSCSMLFSPLVLKVHVLAKDSGCYKDCQLFNLHTLKIGKNFLYKNEDIGSVFKCVVRKDNQSYLGLPFSY